MKFYKRIAETEGDEQLQMDTSKAATSKNCYRHQARVAEQEPSAFLECSKNDCLFPEPTAFQSTRLRLTNHSPIDV